MADEKIVIKIDVDARTTAIEKTTQAVKRLKREAGKFSSGRSDVTSYLNTMDKSLTKSTSKLKRHFDFIDKGVKAFGGVLKKFVSVALKGIILEMAALGAAMLGVHALFVAGKFLAKAYSGAMQILAGGAAAATVAIATAAAAIREQQAAMYAYRGKGAKELGSGLNQARAGMRALQMDADLAGLGVAALNKSYATMSKTMSTPQINASTGLFKNLMDFGAAGQDPAAAAEKVAAVIESLSNSKKSLSDVTAAAKAIGPEMADALKKANVKTKDQLKQLIMSGKLAEFGGVAGQFDAVNNTLIGKVKTFFNLIKGQFADFGQQFLEPAKVAMQKIFNIISRDLRKLMVLTSDFGTGTFMDSLVAGVDKVSSFMVNVIEKWLPRTQGFFTKISNWWNSFTGGWKRMVDSMRPLIDGARVLEKAFSPIWAAIKQGGIDNLNNFREGLIENETEVIEFGNRVGELISGISDFAQGLKKAFFDILPIINDVVGGLTMMFKQAAGFMTMFSGKGAFLSLLPILTMFLGGKKMGATKGGFMTAGSMGLQNMNVNATNLYVNGAGPGVGGPRAPGAAPGAPGFSSGRTMTFPQAVGPTAAALTASTRMTYAQAVGMSSAQRGGLTASQYVQQQNSVIASQLPRTQAAYSGPTATAQQSAGMRPGVHSYGANFGVANAFVPGNFAEGKTGFRKGIGRYRDFAMKQRYMRTQSAYGSSLFGNEALGKKGINNSMTAKMGTAMALSTMSQFAPEEMRGAMALGGAVGAFNPLAGIGIAGIGGAMKAQGAGKGALAGAAGGAAMGAFFGPMGIAVGAGIGLLAGGIMGGVNEVRQRAKEARAAIKSSVGSVLTGIMTERSVEFEDNLNAVNRGGITTGRRGSLEGIGADFISKMAPLSEKAKDANRTRKGEYAQDVLNSNVTTAAMYKTPLAPLAALRTTVRVMSALVPDIMDVGSLIGKIPGMGAINKIPGMGLIKGTIGMDVKTARTGRNEAFLQDLFDNQAKYGMKMTEDELKKALEDPQNSVQEFVKQIEERGEAFKMMDDVNKTRLDTLSKMSGKTKPELEALAKSLGVNLYDATLKFDDLVTKLKINMLRSADEMKAAQTNALLDSTSLFDDAIKQIDATYAIDEKSRTLKDQFDAGSLSDKSLLEYMKTLPADLAAAYGGDPVKAFYELRRSVGSEKGTQFQTGGALEGMAATFLNNPVFQKYMKQSEDAMLGEAATQVGGVINQGGKMVDPALIKQKLASMDPAKQEAFMAKISTYETTMNLPGTDAATRMAKTKGSEALMAELGIPLSALEKIPDQVDAAATLEGASKNFKDAVQQYVDNTAKFFGPDSEKPEWWSKEAMSAIMTGGDTSSPRGKGIGDTTSSRLSQTMSRHASMNSQLTGNRTITSAYRTFGLGSPSSDHATGRAYDLTGQNLGAYSKLVHANGGFAEFHGNNANRHLHVVPGPGAMGDTTVPSFGKMQQSMPGQSGATVTNNITVNGAPGQSPDAIATAVIQKIEARERNIRERR
jgi:hypothetical protein